MTSALIGQPPNNQEDYWIVLGIIRKLGLHLDPAKGVLIPPARPPSARFETRGPRIIAADVLVIVLVILITGSRVLIRALYRRLKWGWDDWFIILASLLVVAWFSLAVAMVVHGGGGKHIWDITYHEYNWYIRLATAKQFIYLPAASLIKISITLFNRRITGLASKKWRLINDAFLVILVLYMITYSIAQAARCSRSNWNLIQLGKAKDAKVCAKHQDIRLSYALVVIHIVLSFCLLTTPIIVLWKVKMARAKKIRPVIVLAFGSVSCVGALMIIVTQYQIRQDNTWNYINLETWITLDLFFGILVASMPILFGQVSKSWSLFKSYTGSKGYISSGSHSHSHSHRIPNEPLPDTISDRKRTQGGMYHPNDVESTRANHFRVDGDDQVELLEQPSKPHLVLEKSHHPGSTVFITAGDLDSKYAKPRSRDESLESAATGPV